MQYNQTVDDCGSHFGSNLLHRISINVIKIVTSYTKSMKSSNFICTFSLVISCRPYYVKCQYLKYRIR